MSLSPDSNLIINWDCVGRKLAGKHRFEINLFDEREPEAAEWLRDLNLSTIKSTYQMLGQLVHSENPYLDFYFQTEVPPSWFRVTTDADMVERREKGYNLYRKMERPVLLFKALDDEFSHTFNIRLYSNFSDVLDSGRDPTADNFDGVLIGQIKDEGFDQILSGLYKTAKKETMGLDKPRNCPIAAEETGLCPLSWT